MTGPLTIGRVESFTFSSTLPAQEGGNPRPQRGSGADTPQLVAFRLGVSSWPGTVATSCLPYFLWASRKGRKAPPSGDLNSPAPSCPVLLTPTSCRPSPAPGSPQPSPVTVWDRDWKGVCSAGNTVRWAKPRGTVAFALVQGSQGARHLLRLLPPSHHLSLTRPCQHPGVQRRKGRFQGVKGFARGHVARKHQSLHLNPGRLYPRPKPFSGKPSPRPADVGLSCGHRGTSELSQTVSPPHAALHPPEAPKSRLPTARDQALSLNLAFLPLEGHHRGKGGMWVPSMGQRRQTVCGAAPDSLGSRASYTTSRPGGSFCPS